MDSVSDAETRCLDAPFCALRARAFRPLITCRKHDQWKKMMQEKSVFVAYVLQHCCRVSAMVE